MQRDKFNLFVNRKEMWKFSFWNVSTFLAGINAFGIRSFLKKRTVLNSNIPEGSTQNILSRDKGIVGSRNAFCLNFIYTRDLGTLWARTFSLSFDRSFKRKHIFVLLSLFCIYIKKSLKFSTKRNVIHSWQLLIPDWTSKYKDHSDNFSVHFPTLSRSTICIYRFERQPSDRIKFSKAFLRRRDT